MSMHYVSCVLLYTSLIQSSQLPYRILLVPIFQVKTQARKGDAIYPKLHRKSEMEVGTQLCLSPKPQPVRIV